MEELFEQLSEEEKEYILYLMEYLIKEKDEPKPV